MAGASLKIVPGHDPEYLYCERCGIKVRPHRTECPQCFGPITRRNVLQLQALERRMREEQALRKELRMPAIVATTAVVLSLGGGWWALTRGAEKPLVAEPVVLGRPSVTRAATAATPRAMADAEFAPPAVDVQEGNRAFLQGEIDRALEGYQKVLEQRPDDLNALNNAGQALVRLGRAKEAVPLLERAVATAPQSWMAQFNLARALGETGGWERAVEHYRAAAVLMPDHYPTLVNLAGALRRLGEDEAALGEYRRAAESDPQQAEPWLQSGVLHERLGQAAEARAAFERFLQMSPESPERPKVEEHLARLGR